MSAMNMSPSTGGPYGGSDDPCILGLTNGTYPNGTLGQGNWMPFGVYMPTASEKAPCQTANDPWAQSAYYGHWTTYFILAALVVVSISNGIKRLHSLNRIMGFPSVVRFHPKISAFFRMTSYPQSRFWGGAIPPLGPSFLLFGFLLFSTLVCFLRRPYYRPPNYGSSPLGLRSEWVATAMVPWMYAAASKRNFLEYFSGISWPRLMTFHKWSPWICLYMSIVHTWAMIIRANRQEPWWYTIQTNEIYWNGFPPLAALVWLCVMSLGPIRKRFYETFYVFHMLSAAVFLIWMYIHLADKLKSWQYMHAATVLWGAAILWRTLAYAFDHGWFRRIPRASFEMLPSSAIRIRIPMPTNRTWSAGSYVYLRFLSIKPWESHPFTISSIIASTDVDENGDRAKLSQLHEMVFIIRPHGGLTARLGSLAASAPSSLHACLVDGPYGGFMDSLRACDMVLLLAGGTGMTTIVPIAQAFTRSTADPGITCCQTCQVHWVMRESEAAEWFKDQLAEIGAIEMYVTGQSEFKVVGPVSPTKENSEGVVEERTPSLDPGFKHGRPNLHQIVHKAAEQYFGRIGVMVCGPTSMLLDARNAVAEVEAGILKTDQAIRCSEIEFYEESFNT
ncbi:uncharacterized protein PGTG_16919 [Puccinia graminis f. sp. tritici CRL 75-36-700-3]|uniref:FAD-binding FR-type domain-containing protein n=1 Tax=Puccinia graminis f. sp. tritici (strain CRL 75-36-700-3 / race SCCL) TaxID=418459 RepID=E3L3P9_PUCGT|nr:uncharacterized protein PGTG_16919 [Puccinia graminis f. sp. tritici CRL 75-36-700-3]EFP91174.2 hypothetical protein PGTG_16919 [Puccinia graminis f. sp. tritici CRL 75-36-700-3]